MNVNLNMFKITFKSTSDWNSIKEFEHGKDEKLVKHKAIMVF